jgi:hypothetical protein
MVLNTTLNNISVTLLRVFFYWWKKPADLEKITYLPCRNGF